MNDKLVCLIKLNALGYKFLLDFFCLAVVLAVTYKLTIVLSVSTEDCGGKTVVAKLPVIVTCS